MTTTMWIVLAALVLLLAAVAWMFFGRKKKHQIDYYSLFVLGIIWIPLGIPLKSYIFSVIGGVLVIIALINKDKWRTNRKSIAKMGKNERMILTLVTGLLVLAVLASIIYLFFNKYY